MNEAVISNAFKAYFNAAGLGWAIAWPNIDVSAPKPQPRLEFFVDRVQRLSPTENPASVRSQGLIRVLAIVKTGTGTTAVEEKAQEVAGLFLKGVSADVTVANARVIIRKAADIRAGFRDGTEWAVPIIASYEVIPA